jgi:hypothetical protein
VTKALVIKTDGSAPTIREIPQGDTYSVIKEVIASPTGGWFDCVPGALFHGYVNDTGIIEGLNLNPIASILFRRIICGDAILFGSLSPQGEYRGSFSLNDQYVDNEYDIPDFVIATVRRNWHLWEVSLDARNAESQMEDCDRISSEDRDRLWSEMRRRLTSDGRATR